MEYRVGSRYETRGRRGGQIEVTRWLCVALLVVVVRWWWWWVEEVGEGSGTNLAIHWWHTICGDTMELVQGRLRDSNESLIETSLLVLLRSLSISDPPPAPLLDKYDTLQLASTLHTDGNVHAHHHQAQSKTQGLRQED